MGPDPQDIPDQAGRTAIVTGGHRGVGLEVARQLARRGAHVVIACPSLERAAAAMADISEELPHADLSFEPLEPTDLDSVRMFADRALQVFDRIHLLVNSAEIALPEGDSVEAQIGTHHLGSFALTNLLLHRLVGSAPARVVTVSAVEGRDATGRGSGDRTLGPSGQSRRANLLFTLELARRLAPLGADVRAIACLPGWTTRRRGSDEPVVPGRSVAWLRRQVVRWWSGPAIAPSALPALYAATSPLARSGDLIGPAPWFELRGLPARAPVPPAERDPQVARRLWDWSESETGVHWSRAA